jgi:catechol 2,3-dioxygenase-like lactoylglutathione lyase family enzyme
MEFDVFAATRQRTNPMFDHISLRTHQFDVMTAFYEQALAPLGIKKLMAFEKGAGFGRDKPALWISASSEPRSSVHLALASPDQSAVRAFHNAALRAGGKDNGAPGPRDFAPNYYAAFVIDPDGNNIEAASRGA